MPPRIKRPANRQWGSPSFDNTRFLKKVGETKYDDIWQYKPVVLERYWRIEQFKGDEFMLEQNFEGRGWLELAKFQPECVVEIVREFYANVKENSIVRRRGRERITSWVRGVEITLTPDDFAQVFRLPRVQQPEFFYSSADTTPLSVIAQEIFSEGQDWVGESRKPVSLLKDKYWALHMFTCTNMLPQNRTSDCSPLRARLIHAIGTGLTIDLPSYMWHQIVNTFEHPGAQTGLPFGGALTEIFRRGGADIAEDLPIATGLQAFNYTSFSKSRGIMARLTKKRKTDVPFEEAETSFSVPAEVEEPRDVSNAALAAQINDLAQQMSQIQRTQQTHGHLLQNILDHLRDSHPPPPP